jgi:hypothetical protein
MDFPWHFTHGHLQFAYDSILFLLKKSADIFGNVVFVEGF